MSARSSFTIYEDPRIIEPIRQFAYGPYQRALLRGERRWDQLEGPEEHWQASLIRRIVATGLRLKRNGATAHISTGYGQPDRWLLAMCQERELIAPGQIVLQLRDETRIDDVLVHKIALFGTTRRKFTGASGPRIFQKAYAVSQEKGVPHFCGSAAKARELIQEMRDKTMRDAAVAERTAALEAEAKAAARRARAEAQAARDQENDEFGILSAFE